MRNPRDFGKPLAIGAPAADARDPVYAIANDPLSGFLQREDGREGARHRADRGHPAWQPRGRGAGRSQGGRARRAAQGRQGDGARGDPAVDARQQPRVALGARRHHHPGERDRRQVVGDHGPEGRGAVGHPLRRPAARAAGGEGGARAADPRPRDPGDRPRRGQSGGDRDRQPTDAGHELWPGGPRRLAPDEDHAGRWRAPRLPGDQ